MDNASRATILFKKFENQVLNMVAALGICNGIIIGYAILSILSNLGKLSIIELVAVVIAIIATTQFVAAIKRLAAKLRRTFDDFDSSGLNNTALEFKNDTSCCLIFFGVLNSSGVIASAFMWSVGGADIRHLSGWLIAGAEIVAIISAILIARAAKRTRTKLAMSCRTMRALEGNTTD